MKTIRHWDGSDNLVMKGYLLYALKLIGANSPELRLTKEQQEALNVALNWATDELTPEEALEYYYQD